MRFIPTAAIVAALAFSGTHAANLEAGKKKAAEVCAACHQADGNTTNGQYPILAGQHADYLRHALHEYQTGARNNAIMGGLAKTLSKADIANLAAWYAAQPSALNQRR